MHTGLLPDGSEAAAITFPFSFWVSQVDADFKHLSCAYIPARRSGENVFKIPTTIEPLLIQEKTNIRINKAKEFLQHILNTDYKRYGAITDNDIELTSKIDNWFNTFLDTLRSIYDCKDLKLERNTKNLSFNIKLPGREPFALHEMSDGYTAFLNIIMELMMRLEESDGIVDYNKSAIVMIDEIETHLHVDMQKKVLPFLTKMFPNVQFIVATHSPFVMTSLENAVVFDLETKERLEKPSFYGYDTIVESFLDTSLYSDEIKKYFARYKELCLKERTPEENKEFVRAKAELEIRAIPSSTLYNAFHALEKERKAAKSGTSN